MLDPENLTTRMREHFATVSDQEFIANLRRYNPDLVRHLTLPPSRWQVFKRAIRSRFARLFARSTVPDQSLPADLRGSGPDRTP